MSAEQNIQSAKDGYAAFARGDIASILAMMDDSIVWLTPDIGVGPGGTFTGKAGVAEFFRLVMETWEFQAFEPKEYVASGDRVVVLGSYTPKSRATGRVVSCDWCMVWNFQNGKLVHFQEYTDSAVLRDAIQQAAAA